MPYSNDTLALLTLSVIPDVTPTDLYTLYKTVPSASALISELSKPTPSITDEYGRPATPAIIAHIQSSLPEASITAQRIFNSLRNKSITPITINSPLYPPFLKISSAPPLLLYHCGTPLPQQGRYITLLSSSKSSPLFIPRTTRIINEIAEKTPDAVVVTSTTSTSNWHILRKCQSLSIPCIAVSPSLPLQSTNASIISESPIQKVRKPKTTFVRHQLLLATISPAIIIIDCDPNSRLTAIAQKAIDHNRYVFALTDPSNPNDGAKHLIESHLASPYTSIDEIRNLTIYNAEI